MNDVRWSIVVRGDTDRALRSWLAATGGRKGDPSRFVEDAVLARLLELTVYDVKDRNETDQLEEILAAMEEVLAAG